MDTERLDELKRLMEEVDTCQAELRAAATSELAAREARCVAENRTTQAQAAFDAALAKWRETAPEGTVWHKYA